MIIFLKGISIGLAAAATLGPMSMLCISNTLAFGRRFGIATGVGIALADLTYGLIVALGVSSLSDTLVAHTSLIRFVGGIFLVWLGWKIAMKEHCEIKTGKEDTKGLTRHVGVAYLLTLSSPMTILFFTAIIASVAFDYGSTTGPVILVIGVFLGSLAWWLILSALVGLLREKLSRYLLVANRIVGMLLGLFGLLAILSVF